MANKFSPLLAVFLFLCGATVVAAQTPGPPTSLSGVVNANSTVTLQWTAPSSGAPVTGYAVVGGTSSGANDLFQITTAATSYTTGVLQPGTYFFRVHAYNGSGVSTASNEVIVTVGCPNPVAAQHVGWRPSPGNFNEIQIVWTKAPEPNDQTTFTVEVGTTQGSSDVLTAGPVPAGRTWVSLTLPNGTYYARVVGHRGCTSATSTSSPDVPIVSGQATGSSQVLVNELGIRSTQLRALDFVELKNIGTTTFDLSDWRVLTGFQVIQLARVIPPATLLAPGCTLLIAREGAGLPADLTAPGFDGRSAAIIDRDGRIRDSAAIDFDDDENLPYPLVEGTRLPGKNSGAYARVADTDTNNNAADFVWLETATPQHSGACNIGPAPSAPTKLQATVNASLVILDWVPPSAGLPLSQYILDGGFTPGATDFGPFYLPPESTNIAFYGVPDGTYYVRLRAVNAYGVSPVSNEPGIFVCWQSCTTPPGPPKELRAEVSGTSVLLTWKAPDFGSGVTGYLLEGGTAPGLSNLGQYPTGNTATFLIIHAVPPGQYYVRIRGISAGGLGGPSNEVLVVIP